MTTIPKDKKILLFDGVCNLCNSSVLFVIKRDPKDKFRFTPLQSEAGVELVKQYNIDTSKTDSVVLIENGKAYTKSSAGIRIARGLSGGWPLFFGFWIVPKFIRNWAYDFIARNRYKWYGKKESCMIPTSELKAKFL